MGIDIQVGTSSKAGGSESRSIYETINSNDYLNHNGVIIYAYDNTERPYTGNRPVIVKAPLIDQPTQDFGVAWGPSELQRWAAELPWNTIQMPFKIADMAINRNGISNTARVTDSIVAVDGYAAPEITINILLYGPTMEQYANYLRNLIESVTPSKESIRMGLWPNPMNYKPDWSLTSEWGTGAKLDTTLSLNRGCIVQLGSYRLIRGLVITGISIQPSAMMYDYAEYGILPLYCKVSLRVMGSRVHSYEEQRDSWNALEGRGSLVSDDNNAQNQLEENSGSGGKLQADFTEGVYDEITLRN